jgi:hypothetical protein
MCMYVCLFACLACMYACMCIVDRQAEDNKESVDKSKAKIKEDVEKKMVEMAMKVRLVPKKKRKSARC